MTYRQIAKIAGCSPGAVGAEVRAMKAEKVIFEEEMAIEQEQAISKNQDIQFELIRF
jgi:hypothetical protein